MGMRNQEAPRDEPKADYDHRAFRSQIIPLVTLIFIHSDNVYIIFLFRRFKVEFILQVCLNLGDDHNIPSYTQLSQLKKHFRPLFMSFLFEILFQIV